LISDSWNIWAVAKDEINAAGENPRVHSEMHMCSVLVDSDVPDLHALA